MSTPSAFIAFAMAVATFMSVVLLGD